MKYLSVSLLLIFISVVSTFALCDELGSYNKTWTTQARAREATRDERQNYYKTLTDEARLSISDLETYPTDIMTCGMGFSGGLAKIFVNGKAGFIDRNGKIVIKPIFKDAGRFSEALAPIEMKDGKWGYINQKGKAVIKPVFDWALPFREGSALVQVGEKWGFIDSSGNITVKPQFDHADSFSEGLAHVQLYREKYFSGYIDKTGKWVIEPVFNGGGYFLSGTAIVDQDVVDDAGKYKYTTCFQINKNGKKLKELEECSRTIRSPELFDSDKISLFFEDYKTGYKTKAGKIIWKPTK